MNASLTNAEVEALLEVLHRGLIEIRLAGYAQNATRAEAIADALHNVPRLITEGDRWGWSIAKLRTLFLDGLTERYPELTSITHPLDGSNVSAARSKQRP